MENQSLVLDFVEWVARKPRSLQEVIETWGTHCPRLTIWEDAIDRKLVERACPSGACPSGACPSGGGPGRGQVVKVTGTGLNLLTETGRRAGPAVSQPSTSSPAAGHTPG